VPGMSVCLSAYMSFNHMQNFTNFLCMLPVAVAQCSSGSIVTDTLCTSGFAYDIDVFIL